MMSWCYCKTIFTPVAAPPKSFQLSKTDYERFDKELSTANRREILAQVAKNLPIQCRTITGEMRYCEKCKALKPDRAHHCSVCGKCVLKMDHHCPWVNNCVCFSNYKFFILFLGYSLLYCIYVAATSAQYFIGFWTGIGEGKSSMMNLHIVFLFFAAIMFAISLMSLFGYHCYLVSKNRSTLEAFQTPILASGPDKEGFNLGRYRNFIEVFGRDRRWWFLPRYTSRGDGLVYPSRVNNVVPMVTSSYHSVEATVSVVPQAEAPLSQGDGLTYPVRTVDEDYDSLLGQRQRWSEEGENEDGTADYFVNDETRNRS